MDGYEKLGRGAVFVVDRPSANIGIQTPSGVQDGIPSMYVPLEELERRDSTVHSEIGTSLLPYSESEPLCLHSVRREILITFYSTIFLWTEPVVSRMRLYNPDTQFVVVFEIQTDSGGMQGADIVTPKRMPVRRVQE